jgi:virginiamycin B lyase
MRTRILALALLLSACGRTGLPAPAPEGGTGGHAGGNRASGGRAGTAGNATGGTSRRGCAAGEGAWCITEFTIPTAGSNASRITAGPDGNLWFTETASDKIGRITPDGVITEFPLNVGQYGVAHGPYGITKGPDGALWFTETISGQIASITTDGHITRQPRYRFGTPLAIVFAADGTVWLTRGLGAGTRLVGNTVSDDNLTDDGDALARSAIELDVHLGI